MYQTNVAYITMCENNVLPLNCKILQMTTENVLSYFSSDGKDINDKPLVRFLLQQIQNYDVDKEVVMGIAFSKDNVLAHVLKKKNDRS